MSQLKKLKFYGCRVSSLPDNPSGERPIKFALNEVFLFKRGWKAGYFKNETSYLASVSSSGRFPYCYRTWSLILERNTIKQTRCCHEALLNCWHSIVIG